MGNLVEDVGRLRLEIAALLREYPELADDAVARLDTLDGQTDIRDVLRALTRSLDETMALRAGLEHRIQELETRFGRLVARDEAIRNLIFKLMSDAQLKKIELPLATLSLRSNPPRLIGDADAATLPDSLCHIKRSVDRTKVREAIEAGREVPGFVMSNAAPSLTVRVK